MCTLFNHICVKTVFNEDEKCTIYVVDDSDTDMARPEFILPESVGSVKNRIIGGRSL